MPEHKVILAWRLHKRMVGSVGRKGKMDQQADVDLADKFNSVGHRKKNKDFSSNKQKYLHASPQHGTHCSPGESQTGSLFLSVF